MQRMEVVSLKIDRLITKLGEFDALREADTKVRGSADRIEPQFADQWPAGLHPQVRESLIGTGITRPYLHQADAICKALRGP